MDGKGGKGKELIDMECPVSSICLFGLQLAACRFQWLFAGTVWWARWDSKVGGVVSPVFPSGAPAVFPNSDRLASQSIEDMEPV